MKQLQKLSVPPLNWKTILLVCSSLLLLAVIIIGTISEGSQQLPMLAQSFLHGKLNFLSPIGGAGQDPVLYNNKVYWSDGPLPAVLLMPFVGLFNLFHHFFFLGYLTWMLILGVVYFILRIARALGYSWQDSYVLMLGFTLGSAFIGVVATSSSWFFAQVLTTLLLFWVLSEFYTREHRRWWLIGLLIGCIALTRITAAPVIAFFLLYLLFERKERKHLRRNLLQLCMPVIAALGLVGAYNYLRFGSPLNSGSMYQLLSQRSATSRALGVFSLTHIPTNFYAAVLQGPIPVVRSSISWSLKFPYIANNSVTGMSIFCTSPYLLQLFTNKWSTIPRTAKYLLPPIGISALVLFSYYGVGALQFGYRYSLDFMPELFVLFIILYHQRHDQITAGMTWLLLGAGIVNFYLLMFFIF